MRKMTLRVSDKSIQCFYVPVDSITQTRPAVDLLVLAQDQALHGNFIENCITSCLFYVH